MNELYKTMVAKGHTAIFNKAELQKFEDYVSTNYETFYDNKATYEVQKDGEQFLVTLFKNPVITMEDILLDIRD
jgi:hypothetical protein|tara:strand:+ start:597 stop:818 length:222 start_codon:yes stop_codon:yes gene_type:complete